MGILLVRVNEFFFGIAVKEGLFIHHADCFLLVDKFVLDKINSQRQASGQIRHLDPTRVCGWHSLALRPTLFVHLRFAALWGTLLKNGHQGQRYFLWHFKDYYLGSVVFIVVSDA